MDIECTQVIHDNFSDSESEEDVNKSTTREVATLKVISSHTLPVLSYPLFIGRNVIGRGENCDICISNQTLSKQHAVIEIDKKLEACEICDLGSANKSRRGKIVLKPNVQYHLEDQEYVRLADIEFQFLIKKNEQDEADDSDTGSESMFAEEMNESETLIRNESNSIFPLDDSKTKSVQSLELSTESKNLVLASSSDEDSPVKKNCEDVKPNTVIIETPAPPKTTKLFVPESDKETNDEETDIEDSLLTLEKCNLLLFPNPSEGKQLPTNATSSTASAEGNPDNKKFQEIIHGENETLDPSIYEANTQPYESLEPTQLYIPIQLDNKEEKHNTECGKSEEELPDLNSLEKNNNYTEKNENRTDYSEKKLVSIEEEFASTQVYVPSEDEDDTFECINEKQEENDPNSPIAATQLYIPSPSTSPSPSETEDEIGATKTTDENRTAEIKEKEAELAMTQLYVATQETALMTTEPCVPTQEAALSAIQPCMPTQEAALTATQPYVPTQEEALVETQLYVPTQEAELAGTQPYVPTQETTSTSTQPQMLIQDETLEATQPYMPSQAETPASLSGLSTLVYSALQNDNDTITSETAADNKNSNEDSETKKEKRKSLRTRKKNMSKTKVLQTEESEIHHEENDIPSSEGIEKPSVISGNKEEVNASKEERSSMTPETDEKLSQNMQAIVVCTDVLQNPPSSKKTSVEHSPTSMQLNISDAIPMETLLPKSRKKSAKKTALKKKNKKEEKNEELVLLEMPATPLLELDSKINEETPKSSNNRTKRSSLRQQTNSSPLKRTRFSGPSEDVPKVTPRTRRRITPNEEEVAVHLPFHDPVVTSPVFNKRRSSRRAEEVSKNGSAEVIDENDFLIQETTLSNTSQHSSRKISATNTRQDNSVKIESEKEGRGEQSTSSNHETPKMKKRGRKSFRKDSKVFYDLEVNSNDVNSQEKEITEQLLNRNTSFEKNLITGNGSLKVDPLVVVVSKSSVETPVPYLIPKNKRKSKSSAKDMENELITSSNSTPVNEYSLKNIEENNTVNNTFFEEKSSRKSKLSRRYNKKKISPGIDEKEDSSANHKTSQVSLKTSPRTSRKNCHNGKALSSGGNWGKGDTDDSDTNLHNESYLELHQDVRRSRRNSRRINETESEKINLQQEVFKTSTPKHSQEIEMPTSKQTIRSSKRSRHKKNVNQNLNGESETGNKIEVDEERNHVTMEIDSPKSKRRGVNKFKKFVEQEDAKTSSTSEILDGDEISGQREQTLSLRQYRKRYNSKEKVMNTDDGEKGSDDEKHLSIAMDVSEITNVNEDSSSKEIGDLGKKGYKRSLTPTAKASQRKRTPPSSELIEKNPSDDKVANTVFETPKSRRGRGRKRSSITPTPTPLKVQADNAHVAQETLANAGTEPKKRGRKPKKAPATATPLLLSSFTADVKNEQDRSNEIVGRKSNDAHPSMNFYNYCASILKPRVMFTGVTDDKAEKIIKDLGGKMSTSITDCTHLVTDKVRRTFKFLCHLARGKPIVTVDWVHQCKKKSQFVDASPFLVHDPAAEKQFKFKLREALEKAFDRPLLQGFSIHVTAGVRPEPSQMKMIIESAGGEYLTRMPASNVANRKTIVVSCTEDLRNCSRALAGSVPVVSAEFILTGILKQNDNIESYCLIT